jgi:hypothetical protein
LTLDQKIERAKTIATTENIAKKEQGLVQATQEKTR